MIALTETLMGLLRSAKDPLQLFRDAPAGALAGLAEAAYQVALWAHYELNRQGVEQRMLLRLTKDELWSCTTSLPQEPATPTDGPSWWLEMAEDLLAEVSSSEGLSDGLSDDQLMQLVDRLSQVSTHLRREMVRRGHASDVIKLLPG